MLQYVHKIRPTLSHYRQKTITDQEIAKTLATWAAGRTGTLRELLEPLEYVLLNIAFQRNRYNITKTAKQLDLDRTTLRNLLRHHGIIE